MAIVYGPFTLLIVAGFVYVAGTAELMQVRLRSASGSADSASPLHRYAGAKQFTWQFNSSFDEESERPASQNRSTNGDIIDAIEVRRLRD